MTELRTERLVLRRFRAGDLEAFHAILGNPEATAYWSTLPHASLDVTREWLAKMLDPPPGESDDFAITLDGRVIGKAGCWRLPEVGYILAPDAWGKGYAREALTAVIAHLFATHAMPRVTADVDPRNTASIRLLERLGFHETHRAQATWHVGGVPSDSVYFALERPTDA